MGVGDKVRQHATHPHRDYDGVIERVNGDLVYVRWHKGFGSWENVKDLTKIE